MTRTPLVSRLVSRAACGTLGITFLCGALLWAPAARATDPKQMRLGEARQLAETTLRERVGQRQFHRGVIARTDRNGRWLNDPNGWDMDIDTTVKVIQTDTARKKVVRTFGLAARKPKEPIVDGRTLLPNAYVKLLRTVELTPLADREGQKFVEKRPDGSRIVGKLWKRSSGILAFTFDRVGPKGGAPSRALTVLYDSGTGATFVRKDGQSYRFKLRSGLDIEQVDLANGTIGGLALFDKGLLGVNHGVDVGNLVRKKGAKIDPTSPGSRNIEELQAMRDAERRRLHRLSIAAQQP